MHWRQIFTSADTLSSRDQPKCGFCLTWLPPRAAVAVDERSRYVPTPSEMVGDRLTAFITIQQFFALLNQFGGYEGLKQAGGGGVIAGQLAVGVLAGVAYARYARSSQRPWLFALAVVGLLWLLTVAFLWPNLSTNYRGLPPAYARIAALTSLLVAYSTYGLVLVVTSRFVRARVTSDEHTATRRRAFLLGGVGAILAVAAGGLLRQLAQVATFAYDGMEYRGDDVQPITPNDRFYTVTKNIVDPDPTTAVWRLEVGGLVGELPVGGDGVGDAGSGGHRRHA